MTVPEADDGWALSMLPAAFEWLYVGWRDQPQGMAELADPAPDRGDSSGLMRPLSGSRPTHRVAERLQSEGGPGGNNYRRGQARCPRAPNVPESAAARSAA